MTLGPVDRPYWWRAAATGPGRCEATCREVIVSQVRVHNFSVSLDGFGTGAGQSLEAPFGHAGTRLHQRFSSRPVPSAPCRASPAAAPASTMLSPAPGNRASAPRSWGGASSARTTAPGRTRSGPDGGETPRRSAPGSFLTHHLRPAVRMNGGTTFDFLDASPAQALAQARQAAAGGDVRIGGGPSTIREFLAAGLIDYAHIVVVPIVLGRGERLWDGLEGLEERFQIEAVNSPSGVTHVALRR